VARAGKASFGPYHVRRVLHTTGNEGRRLSNRDVPGCDIALVPDEKERTGSKWELLGRQTIKGDPTS
jgi:hypothetical protein